jgi:hypothetical protein
MDQGLTHLFIVKIKIFFFLLCTPLFLLGQQFLDLKLSQEVPGDYPPSLNIEFGKKWWGIEAEVGYQFGQRVSSFLDSTFSNLTALEYEVENFRWRLVGNFYPFRNRGIGQGLKLGVGIFDDVEVWRDPAYYEFVETFTQMPALRVNDKAFKRLEYGFQIGYKRIFWEHLVAEASLMYAYRWVRQGSFHSVNVFINILIGYRFSFSSGE